jgi:hypothetical protein
LSANGFYVAAGLPGNQPAASKNPPVGSVWADLGYVHNDRGALLDGLGSGNSDDAEDVGIELGSQCVRR